MAILEEVQLGVDSIMAIVEVVQQGVDLTLLLLATKVIFIDSASLVLPKVHSMVPS